MVMCATLPPAVTEQVTGCSPSSSRRWTRQTDCFLLWLLMFDSTCESPEELGPVSPSSPVSPVWCQRKTNTWTTRTAVSACDHAKHVTSLTAKYRNNRSVSPKPGKLKWCDQIGDWIAARLLTSRLVVWVVSSENRTWQNILQCFSCPVFTWHENPALWLSGGAGRVSSPLKFYRDDRKHRLLLSDRVLPHKSCRCCALVGLPDVHNLQNAWSCPTVRTLKALLWMNILAFIVNRIQTVTKNLPHNPCWESLI